MVLDERRRTDHAALLLEGATGVAVAFESGDCGGGLVGGAGATLSSMRRLSVDADAVGAVGAVLALVLLRWHEDQPHRPAEVHDPARRNSRRSSKLAARPPLTAPEPPRGLKHEGASKRSQGGTLATATSSHETLNAVLAISRDLSAAPTLRVLLCAALRSAATLVRAQQATVYLTGEDDGSMLLVLFPQDELGARDESELEVLRLPHVGPGVAGHVLLFGAATRVDCAQDDSRFSAEVDRAPGYIVESLICAPVLSAAGRPIGAVTLANKVAGRWQGKHVVPVDTRPFDANDERCLALFCSLFGPALERQMLKDDEFYRR